MDNLSIEREFQSILNILVHFSCSLLELVCILALLGLQIALTVTGTCAYRIGVGFWAFPFLCLAPLSIWVLLRRRTILSCFFVLIFHLCSTLFTTAIILISFLVLIEQIGGECSTTNDYFYPLNISLISIAVALKIVLYVQIFLLYLVQRHAKNSTYLLDKQIRERNYRLPTEQSKWTPFRSIINRSQNHLTDLDI